MTQTSDSDAAGEIVRLRAVVEQFRRQVEAQPDSLFPAHADALLRLSSMLGESGEAAEALETASEAVVIYRTLAEVDSRAFTLPLVGALTALSNRLSDASLSEDSSAIAAEAAQLARDAMEVDADEARFVLVSSLINHAGKHLRDGDADSCLNLLAEAAEAFKGGGEAGVPYLGSMIEALHRAAMAFAEVGLWGEAVDTRRIMVGLFPDGPPPAMVQLLALTLQQASLAMAGEGRLEIALECADEAVELARLLFDKAPKDYTLILAQSLGNQGGRRHQAGQVQAALDASLEAVNLFHQVVNTDPAGAVPSLILTLGTLSALLTELGMADQAAIVIEQRTQLQQTLETMLAGR